MKIEGRRGLMYHAQPTNQQGRVEGMINQGVINQAPTRRWLFVLVGVVLIVAALWSYMAFVSSTHETLDQHVYRIGSQLKCPICQGESVTDSSSTLAQQMRSVIREKIQEGQSDAQIIQFFSDRYGNQIVWQPQWEGFSLLTWLVPITLLLGGLVLIFFTLRGWRIPVAGSMTNSVLQRGGGIHEEERESANLDEKELAHYRLQLERELASDDILFERNGSTNEQEEAR